MREQIRELARRQDAVIMAHYYQTEDVRALADVVGDSFELARRAGDTEWETIVLCGVKFMAEVAKILNPHKRVLLPSPEAGCPLADMASPGDVIALKEKHPGAAVMCYVNSSAALKAVSDVCCTSSTAVRIAAALPNREIIFVPDQNLGAYVQSKLPGKHIIPFEGCCPIHHHVGVEDVAAARDTLPGAPVLVHPECRPVVQREADFIGSTAAIIDYVDRHEYDAYIIGTEIEIERLLRRRHPNKAFVTLSPDMLCKQMKKTRVEDVFNVLERGGNEVSLTDDEMLAAQNCLTRMIELGTYDR